MVRAVFLLAAFFISALISATVPQDLTKRQKSDIDALAKRVAEAGKLYNAKKFRECGKKIEKAITLIEKLAADGEPEVLKLIEKDYKRVQKAYDLLTKKNVIIPEVKSLAEMKVDKPKKEKNKESDSDDQAPEHQGDSSADEESSDGKESSEVSFTKQIVPILTKSCGGCHIRQAKGRFSAASYASLVSKKGIVRPGKPDDSELVALVENGEMPPRRGLPKDQVQLIRDWVDQGAKFDGKNKKDRIGGRSRR